LVKKYYPGESKEQRKARKLREKTTGKKDHKPIPKSTTVREPKKEPAPTPKPGIMKAPPAVPPQFTPPKTDLNDPDRWSRGFEPNAQRYIACLKHGAKYSAEYVNTLFNMVKRNMTLPFEFVCFTEDPRDLHKDIRIEPLPQHQGLSGWWYKPMFFNPDLVLQGTVLFIDLDVIVFNNIDKLFTYQPGKFCVIRDFNRRNNPGWNKYNSSCFRLEIGQHAHVYKDFMQNPVAHSRQFHGDQDWLYHKVKTDFVFFPDEWLQSYKWEMRDKPTMTRIDGVRNFATPGVPNVHPDTSVAVFHGEPNPHNCVDPWCKENWI
jgi:hypothetical protein